MNKQSEPLFAISSIRAIIGLGNPGAKYARTRHNIGFMVVDALAEILGIAMNHDALMEHGSTRLNDAKLVLVKPLTFMNASGKVINFLTKQGIQANQILVVHDELEKTFGTVQIRLGGSCRGHNGLKSIAEMIGQDFWRFRFGVGRPQSHEQGDVGSYVLSNFSPAEASSLDDLVSKAITLMLQVK